jgi:hypothetical protein
LLGEGFETRSHVDRRTDDGEVEPGARPDIALHDVSDVNADAVIQRGTTGFAVLFVRTNTDKSVPHPRPMPWQSPHRWPISTLYFGQPKLCHSTIIGTDSRPVSALADPPSPRLRSVHRPTRSNLSLEPKEYSAPWSTTSTSACSEQTPRASTGSHRSLERQPSR